MSYVLEALKKAQAQREQGGVPGIHSLQVPYVAVEGKPRTNLKPVLWAIAGLLIVILGLLAWRMGGGVWALQGGASVATVAQAPSAPMQVAEPVTQTLSKGEVQLAGPAKAELSASKRKEKTTPLASEVSKVSPKAVQNVQPKAQAKDAGPKVYAVAELPEGVRRELPTLVISGGSYSSNPAQRLIIVNNQVFTEKSEPAPGVVVERIEQNAAVLGYKGYSYRVGY